MTREEAFELLKKYNSDPFHIRHAITVEAVMKWFAKDQGYGDEADYWGLVGLLHDIDFELYPDQHCIKAPELLRAGGVPEDIIHGVVSHGYGITVDVKPEHQMEKILFASDELTGLIWAAALMRPSKSTKDMELKSLKKKYKSKGFAAGCSREVIARGAEMLGWDLNELLQKTLTAMQDCEDEILAQRLYSERQISIDVHYNGCTRTRKVCCGLCRTRPARRKRQNKDYFSFSTNNCKQASVLRTAKAIDNAKQCYRRAQRYRNTSFEGACSCNIFCYCSRPIEGVNSNLRKSHSKSLRDGIFAVKLGFLR